MNAESSPPRRAAVVTGGAGAATALLPAQRGDDAPIDGRRGAERAQRLVQTCLDKDADATAVQGDTADGAVCRDAVLPGPIEGRRMRDGLGGGGGGDGGAMSPAVVLTRADGGIAVLTLNRPETLNSLDLEAIKTLLGHLRELAADASVRALLVTGAGRGFCAGWQLGGEGVPGIDGESLGLRQSHLMEAYYNPVIQAFHELPVPSVAAVNGVCAGAGVSIALAADIVLASDAASFVLTFAPRLGLVPDLGASWKLPRLIGWARAQAITMLGERIGAATAEHWGMIWRQVAAASLHDEAMAVARRLAAAPPGVCREVRLAYAAAQRNDLAAQLDHERLRQRDLLDLPSFDEGVRAFQDKREPDFHR